MELGTQVALVVAMVARIRQSWPRIDGAWVLVLALALSAVIVIAQYQHWGDVPNALQLAGRIVTVFFGAVGSASFANYLVQKHADALASSASTSSPPGPVSEVTS